MYWARRLVALATVATAFAVVPLQAIANPSASAGHPSRAVLHHRLHRPGEYRISLLVATGPHAAPSVVDVRIGRFSRELRTGRRHRVRLTARLAIRGRHLTITATDPRQATHIVVTALHRIGRVRRSARHRHHRASAAPVPAAAQTPAPAATAATAPAAQTPQPSAATTGVTGASGSTGASGATGPAGSTATSGPPGDPSSWQMIFDDEFNGDALNSALWSTGWMGSGITAPVNPEELECYDPAQVSVANGELDLNLIAKSETCGGTTRPYTSGIITTDGKFSYTYGYLEARVWVPGNGVISDWPAVWADGQNWPQDGELDVVEGLGGQACWHFHDSSGAPGGCSAATFTGGWHTFGADWEPGSVTYYYDGAEVGSVTSGVTSAPMFVIIDLGVDDTYGGPIAAPATLRVDYVRIWQHT